MYDCGGKRIRTNMPVQAIPHGTAFTISPYPQKIRTLKPYPLHTHPLL